MLKDAKEGAWYRAEDAPPEHEWWWAVEHQGHPAFYLRALLTGDFAPGRTPAARHVLGLDGYPPEQHKLVRCGTCGKVPRAEDLEPIERATGLRGWLDVFRQGKMPWKRPTDPSTCHLCSTPRVPAVHQCRESEIAPVKRGRRIATVALCERCAAFKAKALEKRGRPNLLKTRR